MLKKTFIILGISALALSAVSDDASARGRSNGYEPLFWNGPPGWDYDVLFTKSNKYRTYSYTLKSCTLYKRKYLKTGKKSWLRKYRICKVDRY